MKKMVQDTSAGEQDAITLDRFAYDVTQNWFRRQKTEGLKYCGIHFGEVVRRYLWDKVGRVLRRKYYPEAFAFEEHLLSQDRKNFGLSVPEKINSERSFRSKLQIAVMNGWHYLLNRSIFNSRRGRKVILTRISSRLGTVVRELTVHPEFLVLSPSRGHPAYAKCLQTIQPLKISHLGDDDIDFIWRIVLEGMLNEGIELLEDDKEVLRHEIAFELEQIAITGTYFSHHKPDAVLMDGDNWPPVLNYVLLARSYGIPSIHLQHGLDCEHYFLDEAYADAIAVWGKARKERYEQNSEWQPLFLEVTGNPEFIPLASLESINTDGKYWLWITRPHIPRKCFSPSRSPKEGLDILAAFINLLQQRTGQVLMIKPHPKDYTDLYDSQIKKYHMQDRINIVTCSLQKWISSASIVFSEDSTGGMEAMFFSKPLVHVHFARSAPTIPFTEYGAGVPAFSAEALKEAVLMVEKMSAMERNKMQSGQHEFLSNYAGPMDGQATRRVINLVRTSLGAIK